MKIATGRIVGGRVEMPSSSMGEGERVMVVSLEQDEPATLTPAQEAELVAASEEIGRGDYVTGDDLIADLHRLAGR